MTEVDGLEMCAPSMMLARLLEASRGPCRTSVPPLSFSQVERDSISLPPIETRPSRPFHC